ncbi:MAG: hypothetical protein AMJ65_16940, partial [Phycisphaerae bacterium SG8_4]
MSVSVGDTTIEIELAGDFTRIAGKLRLNAFDFVTAYASFEMILQTVDVDLNGDSTIDPASDLDDAQLLTIDLGLEPTDDLDLLPAGTTGLQPGLFVGVPGSIGFSVNSGQLILATIKANADPSKSPAEFDRIYTALIAGVRGARLEGLPDNGTPNDFTDDPIVIEATWLEAISNDSTGMTPEEPSGLNWKTVFDLDDDGDFGEEDEDWLVVGGRTIDLEVQEDLIISGSLTLKIDGFVLAAGTFEFTQDLDVTIDDGAGPVGVLTNATLQTLSISNMYLFIGTNGDFTRDVDENVTGLDTSDAVGFSISGASLDLAIVSEDPSLASPRSWIGVAVHVNAMSVHGLPETFELNVTAMDLLYNIPDTSAAPQKLDWDYLTANNSDISGFEGLFHTVDLKVSGSLDINIGDFVLAAGTFDITQKTVEAFGDGVINLSDASVLVIQLTDVDLFVGMDGVFTRNGEGVVNGLDLATNNAIGFSAEDASLDLAIVGENPEVGIRSWVGVAASIDSMEVHGLPDDFYMSVNDVKLLYNIAADDGSRIDWDSVTQADIAATALANLSSEVELRVTGTLMISIQHFVYVSGSIAVERRKLFVKTVGSTTSTEVSVLSFGATDVTAFVGVGDDDLDGDGKVDDDAVSNLQSNGLGVSLSIFDLALVLMKPVVSEGAPASTKSYFALKASGGAQLVGIGSVSLAGRLNISINSAKDTAITNGSSVPVVDFQASAILNPDTFGSSSGLKVSTGPDEVNDFVIIDFNEDLLEVSGYVTLTIDEFVHLSGQFAFSKSGSPQTVRLTDDVTTKDVNVLEIGASDVNGFVGVGGPYWVDSNGDGIIDGSDTPASDGAMGLVLSELEFGLALLKPTNTSDTASYYAVKASGGAEIVGVTGLTIRADIIGVEVNGASGDTRVVDFPASPAFAGDGGLIVETGPDLDGAGGDPAPSVLLDFTDSVIKAYGDVTVIIDNFVYVSGGFAFTKGGDPVSVTVDGSSKTVNILTVGANDVNAFVGTGDPDSNGDGMFDSTDDPAGNGAIGLEINSLEFGLALLKPVSLADTSSYYALRATAEQIALVGVPGLILQADLLDVEINGASGPSSSATVPVVDFETSFGGGLVVQTGPDPEGPDHAPSVLIDSTRRIIAASGDVTIGLDFNDDTIPEISLSSFISFEQSFRPNGSQIIKVAMTGLSFNLGDPEDPVLELSDLSGFLVITNQGMAAKFNFPFEVDSTGSGAQLEINGDVSLEINTASQAISEEFVINSTGDSEILELPAGPFLRLSGHLEIDVAFTDSSISELFTLEGDFVLEQITLKDPDGPGGQPAPKAVKIGAANVQVDVLGVSLTDGLGGFVFLPEGIAGAMRVSVAAGDPGIAMLDGDILLEINTTGKAVDQTISVGNQNISIKFSALEGEVVRFAILNASIEIPPFFELSGDFTVQTEGDMTLYGARNVEIFLGYVPDGGSLRDDNGDIKPDAIGLLVENATLGLVKLSATTASGDSKYAVYAYGEASLVGLGLVGLEISGAITVRMNNTGQAIDKLIELPEDPLATLPVGQDGDDNNGNGLIDEEGETAAIRVKFSSTANITEFSAGFDEQGQITGDSEVVISAADIFKISGAVIFTRSPTGRVDVDLPEASVSIRIPDGSGSLQDAFTLTGAARFFFGGGQGFQLEDIRVSGYSIFGVGATIAAPASTLRAPTADLAQPMSMSIVSVDDVDYLYVVYNDVNRVGLNDGSILDTGAEFNVSVMRPDGTAITNGITVDNAAVEKVTDAANDRTFRYPIDTSVLQSALSGSDTAKVT